MVVIIITILLRTHSITQFCFAIFLQNNQRIISYADPVGVWSIVINPSVCLAVCPRAYLWNRWIDPHEILCADPLWPWLGPPLAALRYVMYFRFYG